MDSRIQHFTKMGKIHVQLKGTPQPLAGFLIVVRAHQKV